MTNPARVALIVMVVFLASCADNSEPPSKTGVETEVFFPVHDSEDYPSAQGFGVLREVGGCLLVDDSGASAGMLPVWPEGFSFEQGTLYGQDGSIVAVVGESVELEGGEITESVFEDLTGETIPSSCANSIPFMVGKAVRATS
jgi:hypothetical protein